MEINTTHIPLYLRGELTEEDTETFRRKMETSPEFAREVADLRRIWELTGRLREQRLITDTDARWQAVASAMRFLSGRRRWLQRVRRIAAVAAVAVALGTAWYLLPEKQDAPVVAGNQQVEMYSAYGLVCKVVLPDSSEVWLNSGTRLKYPSYFDGSGRLVELDGEAYFKVKSDLNRRFDVQVKNGIRISAYGTEFNVSAYNDEAQVSAVLAKGNIAVSRIGQTDEKHLLPGTRALFGEGSGKPEIEEVNVYALTAWKDGKMVFRRAGMEEIVRRLSRHFNVDIELHGRTLHEYAYTATFTTQTLTEILNLLALSAPIEWKEVVPVQLPDQTYVKRRIILRTK